MNSTLLSIDQLTMRFGGIVALNNVDLSLQSGSIHAVIGPNGAGKSTLLNVITGLYKATGGAVQFEGRDIGGLPAHQICLHGISRTFQNTELFTEMTALENVLVGMHRHHDYGVLASASHLMGYTRHERRMRQRALELLALVGLSDSVDVIAGSLPFGNQRRLEIARALATDPKLLLLDEPAAGLRSAEIQALNQCLLQIRSDLGVTILVIDHVMALVMKISDHITVLNFGNRIADGAPEDVRRHPEVIKAYLGERAAHAETAGY